MEAVVVTVNPNNAFWNNKRVLVTGHTGFKGGWLVLWLRQLGAQVTGVSLLPNTEPNLFEIAEIERGVESHIQNICDARGLFKIINQCRPEIVFHLAAQPLVLDSYSDPSGTFATNVQGTVNLLESVRQMDSVRVVLLITTDKVYENLERAYPFRETDPLGGYDPYSASKAACEIVISSYRDSFFKQKDVAVASARAGNVIGGGDWSKDRLIPDAVRAWGGAQSLDVRRPQAVRPWQHVLEPLAGYLRLVELMWSDVAFSGAYNFGPNTHEAATVRNVLTLARQAFGRGEISWNDGNHQERHEASMLSLEMSKARHLLGIEPRWALQETVQRTMSWYRQLEEGLPGYQLCIQDIQDFEASKDMSVDENA